MDCYPLARPIQADYLLLLGTRSQLRRYVDLSHPSQKPELPRSDRPSRSKQAAASSTEEKRARSISRFANRRDASLTARYCHIPAARKPKQHQTLLPSIYLTGPVSLIARSSRLRRGRLEEFCDLVAGRIIATSTRNKSQSLWTTKKYSSDLIS